MRWRRLRFFLAVVVLVPLLFVLLPLGFFSFERARGKAALARYQKSLAARGEMLNFRELSKPAPEGENGAPEVARAIAELAAGPVLPMHYPPRMRLTPAGRAVVCFREAEWVEDKTAYQWNELDQDLQKNQTVLERVRVSLATPVLDNQLDYTAGPRMKVTHLSGAKSLSHWFGAECQLALHENRLEDALEPLVAEIRLPRLLARDRTLISELVRFAVAAIARTDTWEALQAEGWPDQQLAQVQGAWEEQRFLANLVRAIEAERILAVTTFDLCRRSNEAARDVLFGMRALFGADDSDRPTWERGLRWLPAGDQAADFLRNTGQQAYCRLWRFAWLDQAERRHLEQIQRVVEIARETEKNMSLAAAKPELDTLLKESANHGFYDQMRFPTDVLGLEALARTLTKATRIETERSLVLAAIALKRYSFERQKPPSALGELVPKYLPSLPIDYMDGKPIKYRVKADGTVLLYSVGEDGVDDQGSAELASDKNSRRDAWVRRDFIWPSPALPEEVEAYRKAQ